VHFAKLNLVGLIAVALAVYSVDCSGMATPEQAMQCCKTMCHSHNHRSHHGQDCCKTTPQMHAALAQPSSVQGIPFSPVAIGTVWAFSDSQIMEFSASIIAGHSHDPPPTCSAPIPSLRI
jgi:hypothetical protein